MREGTKTEPRLCSTRREQSLRVGARDSPRGIGRFLSLAPRYQREAVAVDRNMGGWGGVGSSPPPLPKSCTRDNLFASPPRTSQIQDRGRDRRRMIGGLGPRVPRPAPHRGPQPVTGKRRSAAPPPLPGRARSAPNLPQSAQSCGAEPEAPSPAARFRAASAGSPRLPPVPPAVPATKRPLVCPEHRGDIMLGMIKNSLFGSVETWPWQVLSTGGKVGPQGCREPEAGALTAL